MARSNMTPLSSSQPIVVQSNTRTYPIFVTKNLLTESSAFGKHLSELKPAVFQRSVAVLTDSRVGELYAQKLLDLLIKLGAKPILISVPTGERSKTLAEAERITSRLSAGQFDRSGLLITLGGGVIGDLGGFVASIYNRGVDCIHIPTTIVAQVDSSIGGKTAVNTAHAKNLLGTFYPPLAVFTDVHFLQSLSQREFRSGLAEMIKHAVIADQSLLQTLSEVMNQAKASSDLPKLNLEDLVRKNIEIKAAIVSQDEWEKKGLRALLNFGHTIGHALEQSTGYTHYLHGEVVSIGMVAAAWLSMKKSSFTKEEFVRLLQILNQCGLPIRIEKAISKRAILTSLALDKKFVNGEIRFVLLKNLGKAYLSAPGEVTMGDVEEAIDFISA